MLSAILIVQCSSLDQTTKIHIHVWCYKVELCYTVGCGWCWRFESIYETNDILVQIFFHEFEDSQLSVGSLGVNWSKCRLWLVKWPIQFFNL